VTDSTDTTKTTATKSCTLGKRVTSEAGEFSRECIAQGAFSIVARHRQQLESFRLAPWASRRRRDLLELLDRLNPTIAELSQAIEQEAEDQPEAQRLMTHPGVGPLTALAFVLTIGKAERFSVWEADCELSRTGAAGKVQWKSETAGSHHQTGEFDGAFFAGGGGAGHSAQSSRVAQEVRPPHDATRTQDRQGSDGAETGRCSLLDVAQGMELRAVRKFGSHAGQLGTGDGVQ
jgi:hypothetical protein